MQHADSFSYCLPHVFLDIPAGYSRLLTLSLMMLSDLAPTSSGPNADVGTAYTPPHGRIWSFWAAPPGLPACSLIGSCEEGPSARAHVMPQPPYSTKDFMLTLIIATLMPW